MSALGDVAGDVRGAFEGESGGREGRLHPESIQHFGHAAKTRSEAVAVVRFVAEVADRLLQAHPELIHRLGDRIPFGQGILRSFLDVDHDREREPSALRPLPRHVQWYSSPPETLSASPVM